MANTPTSINGSKRGITNTLTGFVVENETFNETPVQEDFDDQNGARATEKVYDTRVDLKLTVYSAGTATTIPTTAIATDGGKAITYNDVKYKVDSIEEAGTYNGKRRWNITAHKFDNFPPQS